jgi:hypothetical protein
MGQFYKKLQNYDIESEFYQTAQRPYRYFVQLFWRCHKKTKKSAKIARFLKYCSKKYLFLCPKTGYDDTVKKDRVL